MSTTTIRLSDELKKRVAKVAEQAGKSSHAVILDAIEQRIDEEECRDEFHETAERRFAKIAASGETIPWEKMRSFLEDRVSGKQTDQPIPRKIAS